MTGVIGILGGMGPAVTAAFYAQVVAAVDAPIDQDHPTVAMWADARVPDRSAAIEGRGPDPSPALMRGLETLQALGASVIAVPCNTAHYFLRPLMSAIRVPVVDMIVETCASLAAEPARPARVGVMGTAGLLRTGMYQAELRASGLDCVTSTDSAQSLVSAAIALVKSGDRGRRPRRLLVDAAGELVAGGCDVLVGGCTEIPLALPPGAAPVRLVDPSAILARRAVALAIRCDAAGMGMLQ